MVSDIKKRGRPRTGVGTPVQVRVAADQLAALDAVVAKQPKKISRPQAIRTLVGAGLSLLGDKS